jgi:hypothetical protein
VSPGESVEVFSFGRWYAGTVVSVGRTRATVIYTTGSGATRTKAFPMVKVRKALADLAEAAKVTP